MDRGGMGYVVQGHTLFGIAGDVQLRLKLNSSSGRALGCSAILLKNYTYSSCPQLLAIAASFLTLLPPSLPDLTSSHTHTYTLVLYLAYALLRPSLEIQSVLLVLSSRRRNTP